MSLNATRHVPTATVELPSQKCDLVGCGELVRARKRCRSTTIHKPAEIQFGLKATVLTSKHIVVTIKRLKVIP